MLHLDEKQLKAMHTRTNLRRLLEYVANSQVEKIAKMCSKGLDPNFHCQETGGKEKKEKTSYSFPSFSKKEKIGLIRTKNFFHNYDSPIDPPRPFVIFRSSESNTLMTEYND